MIRSHLCFTHCTVLQMKNSTKSISAINPVSMQNMGNNHNSLIIVLVRSSCPQKMLYLALKVGFQPLYIMKYVI